jgi:hypothetical protein|tara:strand:+ start:5 stop:604 length:600 start_codon:yes stop_codon:yes gene_type:complete
MSKTTVASTGIDLSDNFAFTGTVTGTGDFRHLITTTVSSAVASVDFGSTYINSTYKVYKLIFNSLTLSGNDNLAIRIGASGTLVTSSDHIKGGFADSTGSTSYGGISGSSDTSFAFGGHHENTAGSEVQSGEVIFYDLTTSNANKTCIYHSMRVGVNSNRYDSKGFLRTGSQQCDIISLLTTGSENITAGNVSLYGIKQ